MSVIATIGGILIGALGIVGLVRPGGLIRFVSGFWQTRQGLWLAIIVRLVLGVALIGAAAGSRFPDALGILGILSLVAVVVALSLGYERLRTFVQWWAARPSAFIRAWGLVASVLGVFLVYAVY
ncbi:MAG: hypothetical protein ACE5HE_12600 [Phycisphaerae bacterium]